ncbi:MAG: phosphatidate cytidylyltransferase [Candidatus Cloacimonadaceae bacterium]
MSKDLAQRLTLAVIGIPVSLFILYIGGAYLFVLLGIIAVIGMWEYHTILHDNKFTLILLNIILCLTVYLITAVPDKLSIPYYAMDVVVLMTILLSPLLWLLRRKPAQKLTDYLLTNYGWIYIGYFSGLIFRLDYEFHAQRLLLLLLVLIWITDSAAYFIGMRFGKRRGIFPVSPNKSLEGFIAGLVAPFFICALIYFVSDLWSLKQLAFVALSAGLVGQLGDLLESKIKRTGGVKDSSNLFPGHGGLLDRYDSLLLAGPFLYMLTKFIP